MKKITSLLIIGASLGLGGCNLFHHQDAFEMERLSDDVLNNKKGEGISITIVPIPGPAK